MQVDPLFITKELNDQLRPLVKDLIVAQPIKGCFGAGDGRYDLLDFPTTGGA
jgi:hypothetical protein